MAVYVEAPAKRPRGQVSIGSQPNVSSDRLIIQELSEIKNEFLAHSAESFIIEDEATGSVRKNATQEFESSPAFQAAMTIAANRVDRFEGVDDFSRWFSGHLFSHFCFNEITNSLTDGSVLLNEQYSNIVCREVGGIKTIDDNKGIEMGDRSYLADGLQIGKDGRIDKVFEYTLSTDYYKFINQAKGFSYLKQALGKAASPNLEFVFVVPAVSQAEVDEMAERVRRELKASRRNGVNLSVRPMQGITSSEFNGFAKKILRTNKINGEATLSDIVQEKEFLQRASFTSKEKRDEFARHADEMFAGSQHSGQYVITYGQKFEKPVKDVPKATIITLPRRSPASLGEPEFYRK